MGAKEEIGGQDVGVEEEKGVPADGSGRVVAAEAADDAPAAAASPLAAALQRADWTRGRAP